MHVIVVGCGRVGSEVALNLAATEHDVIVIDRRPESFRRLGDDFKGTTMVGVGFDRDVLTEAGITPHCAVAAVTSGDNSNILIARVARETFGVKHVVARIYDPRRASIYERLGIATVASVTWTSARVLRNLLASDSAPDWIDPSAKFTIVERRVPAAAAGRTVADIEASTAGRVAVLGRFGEASIPPSGTLLQEDDVLHVVIPADSAAQLDEALHLTEGTH
jgi:trk system potassium uptake protein TrkA